MTKNIEMLMAVDGSSLVLVQLPDKYEYTGTKQAR